MNVERTTKIEGPITVSEFLQSMLFELGESADNQVLSGVIIINSVNEDGSNCLIGTPVIGRTSAESIASFLMIPEVVDELIGKTLKRCPESLINLMMEVIKYDKKRRN